MSRLFHRTRLSRERRLKDALDALGNSTMTATQVGEILSGAEGWEDLDGWRSAESLHALVYQALETLRMMGEVEREPTGKGRPRWRYFKTVRPLHGDIAELERQFS